MLWCMSNGVELIQADAGNQSVFENLLQFYIHDFSELIPLDVGNDGRYSYKVVLHSFLFIRFS